MRREATAEWIEEQMIAVFRAYPREDVDRTMPVVLLLMARDFGFENLRPDLQQRVQRIMHAIGLTAEMSEDDVKAQTVSWVHNQRVNQNMLVDLKRIFEQHYAALTAQNARSFRRVLQT